LLKITKNYNGDTAISIVKFNKFKFRVIITACGSPTIRVMKNFAQFNLLTLIIKLDYLDYDNTKLLFQFFG
jgi:hypothetical protein